MAPVSYNDVWTNQNESKKFKHENRPNLIQSNYSRIVVDFVFLVEQQTEAEIKIVYYTKNIRSYSEIAAMKSFKNPTASSIFETVPVSNASGTEWMS